MDDKALLGIGPCDHIKRKQPDMTINQEIITQIKQEYRTMPMFENTLFEIRFKKHYSLQTNTLLKCRWDEFKRNIGKKPTAPFQFLNVRDDHFYLYMSQITPNETWHSYNDFRLKKNAIMPARLKKNNKDEKTIVNETRGKKVNGGNAAAAEKEKHKTFEHKK